MKSKSRFVLIVYYDGLQEAIWFKKLHPNLNDAEILAFPSRNQANTIRNVLKYDRPDIVLCDNGIPILVVERTVEVPSGHNVGQRFGRLAAAAEECVPSVYFGPYAAYKHGGPTQGPRYMNLRLFESLLNLEKTTRTPVTTINWPVDADFEIIKDDSKDSRLKEYLNIFFHFYEANGISEVRKQILASNFYKEQQHEIKKFKESLKRAGDYDSPPESVVINDAINIPELSSHASKFNKKVLLYKVGMKNIRSDPYTGMGILYSYLYCGGMTNRSVDFVFYFENITYDNWKTTAQKSDRKDIRMYRHTADWILFKDHLVNKTNL